MTAVQSSDDLELGGHIRLSGFSILDRAELIVVKKIVGSYARKFSDMYDGFTELAVIVKVVHPREKSEKYELHVKLVVDGKNFVAEATDRNLFVVMDICLKKVETSAR